MFQRLRVLNFSLIGGTILLDVIFNAGLFFLQYNLIFLFRNKSNLKTIITMGPVEFETNLKQILDPF